MKTFLDENKRNRLFFGLGLFEWALLCIFIGFWCAGPSAVESHGADSDDICESIPGADVAEAVGGSIVETKSSVGRCVYIVGFSHGDPPGRAFVIYKHEAGDFDGLKDAMEGPLKNLVGIGNEAVIARDRYSRRYWLLTVLRGKAAFQISGDDEEMVRKVAAVALKSAGM